MSDEKKKEAAPAPGGEAKPAEGAAPKKKGKPIILIAAVAVVMILEAVAIVAVLGMTGKKPADAHGAELHGEAEAAGEKTLEMDLLEEEFQTMQGSQIWIWDTKVVLQVKQRNEKFVSEELERRNSEVHQGVAQIFRRATPNQLREPGLETLNRQISAYLGKLLGKDSEGRERIEKILIPRCRGFFAN